jgi:hypothetical protein
MENKHAYSQLQFQSLEMDTRDYLFNDEEGVFYVTLDIKVWGNNKNLLAFFTLEDGRKFISSAPYFQKYYELPEMPIGSKVEITYAPNRKGKVYLIGVKKID